MLVVVSRWEPTSGSGSLRATPDRPTSAIAVVSPQPNEPLPTSAIRFVWRPLPTIMEYAITVQDADGTARWSARTSDTVAVLPDSVRVAPGSVLHWYVDGLAADGRSVSTGPQRSKVR